MKVDKTLAYIFIPPLMAFTLCVISSYLIHENKNYSPPQPEFLTYVDQLGVFTLKGDDDPSSRDIKDVFRHEWTLPTTNPMINQGTPIHVSMIVEGSANSYCIINGQKMYTGDKTNLFKVTSIGSDQVIITYQNGTREIHHVKVY